MSSLTLFDDYATQSSSSVWNPLERRWMLSPSTLPPRTNLSWYTNYDVLYENKGIGGGIEAHKKKKGLMYREMEVFISVLHLTPLSPSSSI